MTEEVPKVFVSYSHDSPAHEQWVAELATRLRKDGVNAVLDQWDLSLGHDVTKFMEDGLSQSDRVLVVCTEEYVRKADAGKGGVGYERMIVTAELVRNLGTQKFIPVIRQRSPLAELPKFMGHRFYVDLSNDEKFEAQYETLLRELHRQPAVPKPPLGKSPFALQPSGEEIPEGAGSVEPLPRVDPKTQEVGEIYETALNSARSGDIVAWRRVVKDVRRPVGPSLRTWRDEIEKSEVKNDKEMVEEAASGVAICGPLFAVALAGVESGRDRFKDQRAVVDDLLSPAGWSRSGPTRIVEFPKTLVFFFQAVHGAACMDTGQLHLALALARMKIQTSSAYGQEVKNLFQHHDIMGWPKSVAESCTVSWGFLVSAPDRMEWLNLVFGSAGEFRRALSAYYLALHVLELADTIAQGRQGDLRDSLFMLGIPLCFLRDPFDVLQSAYRLFLRSHPEQIWESSGVDERTMEQHWPDWIRKEGAWLRDVYKSPRAIPPPHAALFQDIRR